jgi:hemoglobin-like flavoprotein
MTNRDMVLYLVNHGHITIEEALEMMMWQHCEIEGVFNISKEMETMQNKEGV